MQKLNTSFARYINLKYERTGHLFQGRFLSSPIENDRKFISVTRYIFQNPPKAGLGDIDSYIWTNFQAIIKNYNADNKYPSFFAHKNDFIEFIKAPNNDTEMEYENKPHFCDSHCYRLIKKLLKIHKITELKKCKTDILKNYIKTLKTYGISQNQIARITGINRKIIKTA